MMATTSLSEIDFDSEEVDRVVRNLLKKTEAITKRDKAVVGILSAIVFRDVMEHFDKSEGSKGKWTARNGDKWSPSYTKFMNRIGRGGNKVLINNGRLRMNFQPQNVRKVSDGLMWFNNAQTASGFPYAAAHDEGGPKLPKRDFMWLSDKAMESIEDQILRYLEE